MGSAMWPTVGNRMAGYLANVAGPVPLVLDLRIAHDRFDSISDPSTKLTKFDSIVETIIIVPLTLSPLCLLFLERLGD